MPKTKIVNEQMKIIGYRISSETDHLSSVHRALDFNLSTGKLAKIKTWINFHANYRNKNSMSLDFFFTPRKQRKLGKGILKCRMSAYLKNSNNMKTAFVYLVGTAALTTGRAKGIKYSLFVYSSKQRRHN